MINSANTRAHLGYPLTTWLRSPSTLCQRASLCPAGTRKNKNQQTTKRSQEGRSYLKSWIAAWGSANALLRSRFMASVPNEHPRPSLYLKHQEFMAQLITSNTTQKQCLPLGDLQCDLFKRSSSLNSPSYSQAHKLKWMERCAVPPPTLPRWAWKTQQRKKNNRRRKRSSFKVNLTPFTPFRSPFSSESRVKITLWLRLWSWERREEEEGAGGSRFIMRRENTVRLSYHTVSGRC